MGLPTTSNADAPIELSGSLTGLILSRGRPSELQPKERRSRFTKVVLILVCVLAFVGIISVIVATLAGDFIRALIDGLMNSS